MYIYKMGKTVRRKLSRRSNKRVSRRSNKRVSRRSNKRVSRRSNKRVSRRSKKRVSRRSKKRKQHGGSYMKVDTADINGRQTTTQIKLGNNFYIGIKEDKLCVFNIINRTSVNHTPLKWLRLSVEDTAQITVKPVENDSYKVEEIIVKGGGSHKKMSPSDTILEVKKFIEGNQITSGEYEYN
jgi:hypothetical protein